MIHLVQKGNRALYSQYAEHLLLPSMGDEPIDDRLLRTQEPLHLLALESDVAVSASVTLRLGKSDLSASGDQFAHAILAACHHELPERPDNCFDQDDEVLLAVFEFAVAVGATRATLPPASAWSSTLTGALSDLHADDATLIEIACSADLLERLRAEARASSAVMLAIEPDVLPAHLTPFGIETLIRSQAALTAPEITEILKFSKGLSPQDNRVFANIVSRLADLMDREGENAAFVAIRRPYSAAIHRSESVDDLLID